MRIRKINAFIQAQLIKLLLRGEYDCHELAEKTGLHPVTVQHYTRELHRAKAAFICAWNTDAKGNETIRIYKIGSSCKDIEPHRYTRAEISARYRAAQLLRRAQAALTFPPLLPLPSQSKL